MIRHNSVFYSNYVKLKVVSAAYNKTICTQLNKVIALKRTLVFTIYITIMKLTKYYTRALHFNFFT